MSLKKGFTLAEAMITVTIIGVIASMTIPTIIANNRKVQFITGLKKAVRNVDSAIALNTARGERSALHTTENSNLYEYLQKHLDVISTTSQVDNSGGKENIKTLSFYTADGMRYDFHSSTTTVIGNKKGKISKCGTKGMDIGGSEAALAQNPCLIVVDVNGDKKPNEMTTSSIRDTFVLLVSDKSAIPYGTHAQQAFYGR